MTQRLFKGCHSIAETQYRIASARQHLRQHRALAWINGSLNHEFNCSFCLTQSCTIALTLPWWHSSVSRYSVGFDSFPCRGQSPKNLVVSIWCLLCWLQYPRVVMQGSLHLDLKDCHTALGHAENHCEGEAVQKASMETGPAQLWCKTLSRESQQEKSVEAI
jgi:hypothetical protein